MRRAVAILMLWMLCCGWISAQQQHFPYNVDVQILPGHCYDDSHLIFTLTDDNGNIIQIDPQTHNAVNLGQYPLYNVQYHYQSVSGGLGVHYDYDNDIMLSAGTYCVGVVAEIPAAGGSYTQVDTTFCNVQVTTSYDHLEATALSNVAYDNSGDVERYGFRASFHCADVGRIQLRIIQGSFPYTVTILDEQQDTVRHTVFYQRANSGNNPYAASYRDYYTFDSLAIGTYSINVSDSCGYTVPLTFSIPDYEPARYLALVESNLSGCLDETVVPFRVERRYPSGIGAIWCNYNYSYMDSILMYRFINPGGDTTEWKNIVTPGYAATWVLVNDTFPSYCNIFYDTIKMQLHDLCHDTLMTYSFRFLPQFGFSDSIVEVYQQDTIIHDTCATHLPNGVSTQTYKIWGSTWTGAGKTIYGSAYSANSVPFRYYRCPLSYNIWSLPDSTLLGHDQSDEFTGLGTWETYFADTSLHVYVSVTDAQGCTLADKDTVLVYQTEPVDELLFWYECHNDKDDDGKDHCCADRYLWIQEHGVDADTFRRNMTLRLIESPLYNQFNFTAIRQDGVWTVTPDDPNNHSTYLEFSYEDGWRATVRDSVCLPPGRYTFEVSTDCGVDTITYSWAGYYYDTLDFVSAPQYEIQQLCGDMVFTQISTGLVNYMYFIDPEVSNDIPEETIPNYACSSYSPDGGSDYRDSHGRNVLVFSIPGTYSITTYAYNWYCSNCADWCSEYHYHYDTITVAFSYVDFDMAAALLCDASATTGIVTAQAINGNSPYTYTLYSQWGATGDVIATNTTGFFDNVPMTVGQHFSVQVTDSCQISFSVNLTATLLTHGSLVWEQNANTGLHCAGDTVQLTAMNFPPPATYQWSGPNGFSSTSQTVDVVLPDYSENGWYTVEILNSDICGMSVFDSILVPMAPDPHATITGDSTVCPGGSVTLQASSSIGESSYFWSTGDATPTITVTQDQATEYTVTATSPVGCMGTASKTVEIQSPNPISTHVYLCSDSTTTLTARAADAYAWSTGATTSSITVSAAGIYRVTTTPSDGCSVVDTFVVTTVKVNGISNIDIPDICAGDTAAITVGHAASCNLTIIAHETILALNDTVFLPDGADCPPYGCSYQSSLHFAGYEDTAKVNSVDDIRYVRLNIEHSFAGDIYINITCPNGQKADILRWGDYQMYPDAHTYCASIISDNSKGWQSDVEDLYNASQGTRFGVAYKPSDSANPCDASRPDNAFGTGWNYCWSNNTSEGYTYAGGTGSLIYRECNAVTNYDATPTYYWSVPVYPKSFDSSNVAIGTQFYHPDESFDSLVGCPLNGDWYIEVMDGVRVDNGYIFGWELALAPDIQTIEYVDVVNTTVDGPWVTATSDSSFLFTPPANIDHDTTVSYTFHCHSQFGCGYDTVVSVTFHPRQDIVIDTTACNSLVWNGVTYTTDTTLTDSLTNVHGCDSIITVNIHVITTPSVDIIGSHYFCPGDTVLLTAVAGGQAQYLWSNGETDSTIMVTEAGVYTVTAYFPGGCSAESDEFHLFEVENPILDGFLNDMVAGDTQTVVIGTVAGDNLQYQLPQSTLTYSTVTFLPDGEPCGDPPSCSYKATMSFSGFPETAVIHSADEIRYIRLNMEHSWIKDLYINLTCPSGKSADILKKFNGNSSSPCLDSISPSHRGWQNNYFESTSTSIYFGYAFFMSSNENRCDSNIPDNQPGTGWNYCWSNNTTEGYQYAPGAGSLVYDPENVHIHTVDYLTKYVVDSSDATAGTNFYHPDDPFDSLVGCPVNGLWTVEVIDGIQGDNGYIFECELSVAEQLCSTHYAHVSEIGFEGLWAENGSADSSFVITPPSDLANDTVVGYTFTLTDENGCVFDTTIYIHIYAHKHTDLYDTVLADELPYVWNGPTITHAGCSDTLLFTTHGADSVVTMHLSVIYPFDTTICTNVFPLSWHGHTFNGVDTLTISHPLACGCDSMEVLTVSESPVYQDTSYVSVCESNLPYMWHGQSLNATGVYADTLFTVAGCDSIFVLNLHVEDVYVIPMEASICQGDTFLFFDQMLTQPGVYPDTLQTSLGCDSVIILNLTVNPTYNIPFTVTICQGDAFFFFGQLLIEEGVYADTMQTVAGCDSVITLNLVVNPTYNIPITGTICQGDTFLFFGQQLTEAGEYTETLQTVKGCDSVITLTLTVNPTYSIPVSEAICAGDTFDFHGESLTEAGVYLDTLQTISGCDSIIVLNLSVNPVYHIPLSDTICAGDTFYFFSQALTSAGVYTDTLQSISGCDSIITLNLVVNPVYNIPLSAEICAGDTFLFFGQSLMTTGLYTDTLQTVNGCDSVISLNLTVNEATSETIVVNIVENDLPYEINQTSYDSAGTYIQHLTNAADCDSLLTIHLFVANNTITHQQAMICQNMLPAVWQGHVWHGAGVVIDTLEAANGADSIEVLTLTVGLPTESELYDTILQNNLPYVLNDSSYFATGVYVQQRINVAGCDSTITFHLTVLLNQRTELDSTVCDSLLPVVWNGITFTDAGVDSVLLEACNGVDSTVVMTVNVKSSSDSTLIVSEIENNLPYELNSFEYNDPGTYTQSLDNAIGCDSTLTLVLTVLYNVRTEVDSVVCDSLLPITWNGVEFTGAGADSVLLTASTQVDSLVVMTLTVNYPTTGLVTDTVVQNNLPYLLNGTEYDTTGIYLQHLANVSGCDSTLTLDLTVLYNVKTYLDSTVCDSLLPVQWNGITFTEAGMDTVIYQAANGADSMVVMTLNVNASSYNTIIVNEIENNLPYTHNGIDYDSSGIYIQHLENALGCDSTLIIELTVLYNVRAEVDSVVCDSLLPITWNGVEFSSAGTDSVTILATSGVDSTVVMTVTIAYPTAGTFADTVVENSLPYQLNGFSYDSAGVYTQHLTNVNGCDSTLTFGLTVLYNVASEADSAVCPNALPIVWNGKTFTAAGVQSAVLTAANGVDSTVTMTVTTLPSPTAHISGPSVLCADSYTTLTADSAMSYLWSNGMTTQSINVHASGSYSVTVTNELGCTASETYVVGNVVTVDPLTAINLPSHLCAGNSYTMTAGYHSTDNFVIGAIEETHSVAETVFLPDGIYCSPYGCSYQSPLTFTDFAAGSTVTNVNDIRYVRLNMEHSYAGDIYINITCPNGQKADIMKYAGTGTSSCTGSIPAGSIGWQSGNNASQSTFFGMAYDYSTTSCNSSVSANAPGVGWNYCWSNNTDQGYSYAPGTGSLIYRSANSHYHPYAYGTNSVSIFDSSNVAAGTQFYHPDQSFSSLIGCPLNGSWYIEVVDGYSIDNGYLFGWELALASTFATSNNTEVVAVTVEGPWATMTDTTTFVISPPDTLQHDTLAAYTVHFYDENGCGYDTVVFLDVYAQSHIAFDTTVCSSFVWAGTTYTQSQIITWNGVNAHGCDSTVAINLSVYPNPAVSITGQPVACVDDTAHLVAACADTTALLVWSTGDTAQTITVTTAGTYTVTATNAGGCTSESTVTVAFSSPSQSITDTTVCDSFLWNGTLYTQTGTYRDTLTNAAGCDSMATLNLTVKYSYLTHDTLQLLQSQLPYHFVPSDTTFAYGSPAEFQFSYTLPAQNGCDSVILEKVYIYMNYSQSFDTTVCASAVPLTWHGHTFTATATVTDSLQTVHGSDSVLTYTVTVDAISANIGNVTHIACYGDNTGAATATVTGGISPLAYQWTNGAGASVSTSTQISNRPAGDYTFTVTDAAGCSATASVTLNTLHGQMLPGDISGPQTLCFGDTIGTISGTAATGDGCLYQWQISTDGTSWTPLQGTNNTQNYTFQTPVTNSFHLRRAWISADCGTLYSDTLDISVWPVSSDTIYDDICVGNPYNEHGFNISETETVGLGTLTSWMHYTSVHGCDSTVTLILDIHEPRETDISAEVCEGTGYYANGFAIPASETVGEDSLSRVLNLQTVDGCDSIVRLAITVIDTALRIVSPTADFCEDMSAELFVETSMTDYEWSTGEQTPNITVTVPGVYKVTASEGGCSVTAQYVIEPCVYQLYLPNAITPGRGDGLNDYFYIPELAKGSINLFEISVFNRWGEMVFYSTDKNFQWNGEYKGKIYHQTVYTYIIEYTDYAGRPFRITGTITVL